jgi:hypothetical protein
MSATTCACAAAAATSWLSAGTSAAARSTSRYGTCGSTVMISSVDQQAELHVVHVNRCSR